MEVTTMKTNIKLLLTLLFFTNISNASWEGYSRDRRNLEQRMCPYKAQDQRNYQNPEALELLQQLDIEKPVCHCPQDAYRQHMLCHCDSDLEFHNNYLTALAMLELAK